MTKAAAFFDLDLTLLTVNSGHLWMARERRMGRLSLRNTVEAFFKFIAYRLSIIDMEDAMRKALALYVGETEEDLDRWTREWYEDEVAHTVAPGAHQVLQHHRDRGHPLVLHTSSSLYLSRVVSKQLDLDDYICSRYEVGADGRFTGEPVFPLCYGAGKVTLAERWAAEAGVDLSRSYFYSDSYTDLPMLQRVGQPRVVNPDMRLKRYARKRGWTVLDWL